jgi:hypothetical protein
MGALLVDRAEERDGEVQIVGVQVTEPRRNAREERREPAAGSDGQTDEPVGRHA